MVYLIEDDPALRRAICFLLEVSGLSFRAYRSGEEFLEDDRPSGQNCLITDQTLPGLTGLEIVEHLRREKNPIPAMILSSDLRSPVLAAAERRGIQMIRKPCSPEKLISWIRESTETRVASL